MTPCTLEVAGAISERIVHCVVCQLTHRIVDSSLVLSRGCCVPLPTASQRRRILSDTFDNESPDSLGIGAGLIGVTEGDVSRRRS